MSTTTPEKTGELSFRIWTALAPDIVEAGRDWSIVRKLLEPYHDAIVYGWREEVREDNLRLAHVFLCAGEATAHLAMIGAPSRLFRDVVTPEIKPKRTMAPIRIGDHLGDDEFLDNLCIRLASVTPYDPATLPDASDWLWVVGSYDRYNLLTDGEQIVLPPPWSGTGPSLGPILFRTTHLRIFDSKGHMGLLSREGVITVPCRYAYIGAPDTNKMVACEASINTVPDSLGPCDLIDTSGQQLNSAGIKVLAGSLWAGIGVAVREEHGSHGLKGYIAADGNLLGDIRWRTVTRHHNRMASVQDAETGLWGFVDERGCVRIEPRFTSAAGFINDRAVVSLPETDGLFGLINPSGTLVVPGIWHDICVFNGNLFHVTDAHGAIGLIDNIGRTVIEPRHPTPEEQEQSEKSRHVIRGHPFSLLRAKQLRERVDAAIDGSDTLAPIEGMLMPNAISDTELEAAGLLGARVQVVADHLGEGRRIASLVSDVGRIGWHYPVNGSLFDLAVEAPVEGLSTFPHGVVGVSWRLLRRL